MFLNVEMTVAIGNQTVMIVWQCYGHRIPKTHIKPMSQRVSSGQHRQNGTRDHQVAYPEWMPFIHCDLFCECGSSVLLLSSASQWLSRSGNS
jgi:hypothetical protein